MEAYHWGIAGIVLGAVVTFILNIYKDWLQRRAVREKDICYLSILTVSRLEKFFEVSVSVSSDNGRPDKNGDCYPITVIPKFIPQDINVDWRCLPQTLMYEILDFPTQIEYADNLISGASEHWATPPDYSEFYEERQYQYSLLGLKALELAIKLRKLGKLPKYQYAEEKWEPHKVLLRRVDEIEKIRVMRNEARSKMLVRV